MSCNICEIGVSKYKCPSCRIPYCSIPCWKTHKSAGCGEVTVTPPTATTVEPSNNSRKASYLFPTEDTVPPEKLKLLGDSEELKNILCNPHVRTILSSLDNATNPSKMLHDSMQEPIFVEFVDECMKILYPPPQIDIDEAFLQ